MALNEHQQHLAYRFARLYAEDQGYSVKQIGACWHVAHYGETLATCPTYDGAWQWVFEFLDCQM